MVEKNFTKIPNVLLDNMQDLGITNNRYLLILIYTLRHKKGYRLSNKQIENALSMHHKTVKDGINNLYSNNLLDYKETSQGKVYDFANLLKKIKEIEKHGGTAEESNNKFGDIAVDDNFADGDTAEGGDKSAEGVRRYGRRSSAVQPTNKTNYKTKDKINYKTSSSFLKIRSLVEEKIQNFFNNMLDDTCKEIIKEVDPSFYKFKEYQPKDKEIEIFLENNDEKILDKFDVYLYNGIVSESFIYGEKLIKPRLALLNNNKVRLNELLNIYYEYEEDNMEKKVLPEEKKEKSDIEKKRDALFKNAPSFSEFIESEKDNIKEEVEDKYSDLPEEEANWLRAVHSYDPNQDGELITKGTLTKKKEEGYEATEEEIDEILKEFPEDDEEEVNEEDVDEILEEIE